MNQSRSRGDPGIIAGRPSGQEKAIQLRKAIRVTDDTISIGHRGSRTTAKLIVLASVWVGCFLSQGRVCDAAVFADFSASRHDRFIVNDPADPDPLNPSFFLDHSQITGVGLTPAVLITPQHFLTATHVGITNPTFVAADGTRRTYTASTRTILQTTLTSSFTLVGGTVLPAGTVRASDLSIVRLSAPIAAADGIDPLPLFSGNPNLLAGRDVNLFVQSNRAGSDTIDFIQPVQLGNAITHSLIYRFDSPSGVAASDELRFTSGDSGRASIVDIDGQMMVVGTHMAIATDSNGTDYSIDNFVLPYLDQIQSVISMDGYSLNLFTAVAVPEPSALGLFIVTVFVVGHTSQRRRCVRRNH